MKSPFFRPFCAVGLLLLAMTACQSEIPLGPDDEAPIAPAAGTDSPDMLLGLLSGGGGSDDAPRLIPVRRGERLTPEDATLSFLEGSLSFPAEITKGVDGRKYVSFKFGPNGLSFEPAAVLAISIDKADLGGIDPRRLRIAVASDDRDDWRVVGGLYMPLANVVVAPVSHFSRYALCVD